MKIRLKRMFDSTVNILFTLCLAGVVLLLLNVVCLTSFRIPSDSMTPVLVPGDHILVEKWSMGARIFDIRKCRRGTEVEIHRLPALGIVKRNDVLVFNFPYYERWDSMGIDWRRYYVKRCLALPGDTFSIEKGIYRVKGYDAPLGNVESQEELAALLRRSGDSPEFISMRAYPLNDSVPWTVKNFGPFYLPEKGAIVPMNIRNALLYRNAMEWEQKKRVSIKGNSILLDDSLITEYCFQENYYFVAGDNVMSSQDSRYWGLIPEPHIVGKARWVWKSINPYTDKIRWERVLKKVE